jgi:hypothetical protein
MTHLIIWVEGGLNFQTRSNVAADLAGLINAQGQPDVPSVYSCTNLFDNATVYIRVDKIVAFQDVQG